ncbi:MAG TPA: hypothetical protein PK075_03085 [Chitinophagales bacterium]|nr:hypothetical protein [Chitinophagales bacterium]
MKGIFYFSGLYLILIDKSVKNYKVEFVSYNQPVMIGRFMLIFSRRRIDVTNFSF